MINHSTTELKGEQNVSKPEPIQGTLTLKDGGMKVTAEGGGPFRDAREDKGSDSRPGAKRVDCLFA